MTREFLRTQLVAEKNAVRQAAEVFLQQKEDDEDSTFEQKYYASNNGTDISMVSIIYMFIFFPYSILAGLHYSCIRTIDFVTILVVICLSKHHHHHHHHN
jgi:hypothetical protein